MICWDEKEEGRGGELRKKVNSFVPGSVVVRLKRCSILSRVNEDVVSSVGLRGWYVAKGERGVE